MRVLTAGRSRSGRCSNTFLSLWRTQRCTATGPNTSLTAARSALLPSSTTKTPCSTSRPLPTRSESRCAVTVLFSVEPSQSPSGTLVPSVVTPRQTTQQRPLSSTPSSISAARRMSPSGRDISARRCSPVRPTNSRETADFEVERSASTTSWPTGSRVRANRRVLTPASICSSTTRVNGSRSAKCAYVSTATSYSPSAVLTRGRRTPTRRPPSVTSPVSWPWRTAARSGLRLPFGPTTSSTSVSIISASTPSPTPTLNASSPSLAALTNSPSASCTLGGNASSALATCSCTTVLMAVPSSRWTCSQLATVPTGPDEARDRHRRSSTSYGATSAVARGLQGQARLRSAWTAEASTLVLSKAAPSPYLRE